MLRLSLFMTAFIALSSCALFEKKQPQPPQVNPASLLDDDEFPLQSNQQDQQDQQEDLTQLDDQDDHQDNRQETDQTSNQDENTQEQQKGKTAKADLPSEDDFDAMTTEEIGGTEDDQNGFTHPSQPTAWHTRTIIMSAPRPTDEKLISCRNDIEAISNTSPNEQGILYMQKVIVGKVADNVLLHHWCFYFSMMRLDNQLIMDKHSLFEKKEFYFFK